MSVVIKVEDISKQYRLGTIGAATIKDDFRRWWAKVRGMEDPFLRVGEVNNRTIEGKSDYVWALRDINFDVNEGEVFGIIGNNGAGKSTLLKILAQVTQPTTGQIKIRGRVASLLEVGTGFHPELTGRENIFLNGAILGMGKAEIRQKLDEIIAFSGVERYIDTPVKRYSSGMYVRLAFAVAAHLEPEILIVDEVLAVGDMEFQQKCMGKMKDVAGQGRTVLFVSHNMTAIRNLCDKGMVMNNGQLHYLGEIQSAVEEYKKLSLVTDEVQMAIRRFEDIPGMPIQFTECRLVNPKGETTDKFEFIESIGIEMEIKIKLNVQNFYVVFLLHDENANLVLISADNDHSDGLLNNKKEGVYKIRTTIPARLLNLGKYFLTFSVREMERKHHKVENCLSFQVSDTVTIRGMKNFYRKEAMVAPELPWELTQ